MRPMLHAQVPLPRKTAPGAVIEAIDGALADTGLPRGPVAFHIHHDVPRVLERITLAQPLLAPFWQGDRITDAGAPAPLPPHADLVAALADIAAGISRRFQVQLFFVHFGTVDWGPPWMPTLDAAPAALPLAAELRVPAALARPGLAYRNGWWVSGRQQALSAMLVGVPLARDAAMPPVPPVALAVLNRVAKVSARRFQVQALPTAPPAAASPVAASERNATQLRRALRSVRVAALERMAARVASGALPHDLRAPAAGAEAPAGLDRKGALLKALRPAGWAHHGPGGGPGLLAFWRATDPHTRLTVEVDFGTWSRRMAVTLRCQGASWQVALPVQFHDGGFHPTTAAALAQGAENLAAALDDLCARFVPELEAVFGPSPAWTAAPSSGG